MSFIPANPDAKCRLLTHNTQITDNNNDENTQQPQDSKLSDLQSLLDYDDIPLLSPDESLCFAFVFTSHPGLVHRIAGYPVVRYNNSMGEGSVFKGEGTAMAAGYTPIALIPQPIKFLLAYCPSEVKLGEEFEVTLRLFNTTVSSWPLRLDCVNNNVTLGDDLSQFTSFQQQPQSQQRKSVHQEDPGLVFVGVTSRVLGTIDPGSSMECVVTLCAASIGLHDLPTIFAMHSITKERYASSKLCKVLVVDRDASEDSTNNDNTVDLMNLEE